MVDKSKPIQPHAKGGRVFSWVDVRVDEAVDGGFGRGEFG
jgi:hypothetical protein